MRPIDKKNIGEEVILNTGEKIVIEASYHPYQAAKPALVATIGSYCSYCENAYSYNWDLHVEHVQPKGLPEYASLEFQWSNFLLSCATCNGKGQKGAKNVILTDIHLPHQNNTFLSLVYKDGGVVTVNPALKGNSFTHASNLINIVGLNRSPKESSQGDTRWRKRQNDWNKAKIFLGKYLAGKIDVDTIIELVKTGGGWSIWFTVFKGQDEVLSRLISDFPGTCATCFDKHNHYEPLPRNPEQDDPI